MAQLVSALPPRLCTVRWKFSRLEVYKEIVGGQLYLKWIISIKIAATLFLLFSFNNLVVGHAMPLLQGGERGRGRHQKWIERSLERGRLKKRGLPLVIIWFIYSNYEFPVRKITF